MESSGVKLVLLSLAAVESRAVAKIDTPENRGAQNRGQPSVENSMRRKWTRPEIRGAFIGGTRREKSTELGSHDTRRAGRRF